MPLTSFSWIVYALSEFKTWRLAAITNDFPNSAIFCPEGFSEEYATLIMQEKIIEMHRFGSAIGKRR